MISAGIVEMFCEKIDNVKSGISKNDGFSYRFEYFDKDDLPDNFIKLANNAKNVRRRKKETKKGK